MLRTSRTAGCMECSNESPVGKYCMRSSKPAYSAKISFRADAAIRCDLIQQLSVKAIKTMKKIFVSTLIAYSICAPAFAQTKAQAQEIFEQYQSHEKSFDPSLADFYCDDALIQNTRTYPTGEQRTASFPAPRYKQLIQTAMPLAQAKGDYSIYSDVVYKQESNGIRITANRHSVLKKYSSPISILVGSCNGKLLITEEISQSRP